MIGAVPAIRSASAGEEFGQFKVIGREYRSRGRVNCHRDWVCKLCGYSISASGFFNPFPALQKHEDVGHTPCERCGVVLGNCKDGSPRRHNWRLCPEKDESYRVVSIYDRERAEATA